MDKNIEFVTPEGPPPEVLARSLRAMVVLDIVMLPEEESWLRLVQKTPGEDFYHIENGSGDELDISFSDTGVWVKGFDHENALNQFAAAEWDEVFFQKTFSGVPQEFLDGCEEEALQTMTFCMWYDPQGSCWKQNVTRGNDGGKAYLLGFVCRDPSQWIEWAGAYYEREIDRETVEKAYRGAELTEADIHRLNAGRDAQAALREINAL